ncbi:MAG: hypothetical protein MZW92_18735 [Comamonadaceae bacterium]|nr:hypothetical protein [Comamonadaceae bacterium]
MLRLKARGSRRPSAHDARRAWKRGAARRGRRAARRSWRGACAAIPASDR